MAEKASDLLSVQDVADLLKVSRATVHKFINEKRLKPAEPDNPLLKKQRRQFRRADVERLLRGGQ